MNVELVHTLGLVASVWLLLMLFAILLTLVAVLYLGIRIVGTLRRRLERALRRARSIAQTVERGTARSARVAATPLILGHRVGATVRAAWRRVTGPVRAWRGAP